MKISMLCAALGFTGAICALAETPPALEGLDPVRLTEGQEVPGKDSITLQNGRFLYQFSSEENRERFRKEPGRYGIQLDGACARMGAPVNGSPDAYFVYDHRIYVFGSRECYRRFSADPKKYLESAQPKPVWTPTEASRAKGKALLDRAIDAMGGAAAWAAVTSFAEIRHSQSPGGEITIRIASRFPDSLVAETTSGGFTYGSLVLPNGAWGLSRGAGRPIPESFGRAVLDNAKRDFLPILLGRNAPGFEVYYDGRAGDNEQIRVNDQGRISTLSLDSASAKVTAIQWIAQSPDGFLTYRISYSDYRPAGALQLPYRAAGVAEETGQELPPGLSWTAVSYELNPPDIEARLRVPAPAQE